MMTVEFLGLHSMTADAFCAAIVSTFKWTLRVATHRFRSNIIIVTFPMVGIYTEACMPRQIRQHTCYARRVDAWA